DPSRHHQENESLSLHDALPILARGEIQCIGATTLDEYRQYIEKDGALDRRFQKVTVEPTTYEDTIEILNRIKDKYEEHHNVTYTDRKSTRLNSSHVKISYAVFC